MKKRLVLISVIIILVFSFPAPSTASSIGVTVDDAVVVFNEQVGYPFIDGSSRTQVPFRATMEKFGCTVSWEQSSQVAVASKNGITVRVPIGQKYIYKNGIKVTNDTSALIRDNRTYLPIRVVLEAFGASVSWNPDSQTVVVHSIPSPEMKIYFLDVGQADAIFVDFGDYEILVDAGGNDSGSMVVNYIKPFVQGDLDVVVATHAHADHIGGLDHVINSFQVDNIIDSGEVGTTVTYKDYYAAASGEANCNFISDGNMFFEMGDQALFKVIEVGDGFDDSNENSVVTMVDYNEIEVLLMGDLDSSVEASNLTKFGDVDILKAGHHGSRTASSTAFLNMVKPETIIISAGLNNQYGHPHQEAIARMLAVGSALFGTYQSGTIIATTDGHTYSLNTSSRITSAGAGQASTTLIPQTTITTPAPVPSSSAYVGSVNSNKYHYLNCPYVSSIHPENLIYFKSKAEAESLGYVPCKGCKP
jgi:beta-lactamase superfamily II metal-dependent hydrolase